MGATTGDVRRLLGLLPQRGRPACASCGGMADLVCARCRQPVCRTCDTRSAADAPSRRGGPKAKEAICLPCALEAGELDGAALVMQKRMAETARLTGRDRGKAPSFKSKELMPSAHAGLVQLACFEAGVPAAGQKRFSNIIDTARRTLVSDIALSHKASQERSTLKVDRMVGCLDQYYDEILGSLRGEPLWDVGVGTPDGGGVARAIVALEDELRLTKLSRYFRYHGLGDPCHVLQDITAASSSIADKAFEGADRTGPIQLLQGVMRAYGRAMEYDDYEVSTFQGAPSRPSKHHGMEGDRPLLGRLVVAEAWMGFASAQATLAREMPQRLKGAIATDTLRLGKAVLRAIGDTYRPGDKARKPLEAIPKTIDAIIEQVTEADEAAGTGSHARSVTVSIRGVANLESLPLFYRSSLGGGPDEAHLAEAYDQWMVLLLGRLHDGLDAMGRGTQQASVAEERASQLLRILGELDGRYLAMLDSLGAGSELDLEALVPVHRQFWGLVASMIRRDLLRHADKAMSDAIGPIALDQVEALADLRRAAGLAATPVTDLWLGDRFAAPRAERPPIVRSVGPRPDQPWEEVIGEATVGPTPAIVGGPAETLPTGPLPDRPGEETLAEVENEPPTATLDGRPVTLPIEPPPGEPEGETRGTVAAVGFKPRDKALPPPPPVGALPGQDAEEAQGEAIPVHRPPPPPVVRTVEPEEMLEAMRHPPRVVAGKSPVSEGAVGIFLPGTEAAFNALKDGLGRSVQLSEAHLSEELVELPGLADATPMREAVQALVCAIIMAQGAGKAGPLEVVAFVSVPDPGGHGPALGIVTDPWIVAEERAVRALAVGRPTGQGNVRAILGALRSQRGPIVLLDERGTYLEAWTWGLFRELHLLTAAAEEPRGLALVQIAGNRAFLGRLATGGRAKGLLRAMNSEAGGG